MKPIGSVCQQLDDCTFGELNVYDSRLTTLSPATLKVICSLLHCSKTEVTVNIMQLQQQSNGSDCGVYAIACAASLCNGDEPSDQCWDEKKLRLHRLQCFESMSMSVFPTSAAAKMKAMHAQCTTFRDKILNLKGTTLLHLSPSMAQGRYDTVWGVYGMVSPKLLVFALPHFQEL